MPLKWGQAMRVFALILATTGCDLGNDDGDAETPVPPALNHLLTIQRSGSGAGLVTSAPGGIQCGSDCTESYPHNSALTLSAAPAGGSRFTGWVGCDESNGSQCTVNLAAPRLVTAVFDLIPGTFDLTVLRATPSLNGIPKNYVSLTLENGAGTVTSDPSGINCGTDCTGNFPAGSTVVLTATADANAVFSRWDGCAQVEGNRCTVTLEAVTQVTARFTDEQEHTEPDIRVNPEDPDHAIVSWMQKPDGGADLNNCAMATTFDHGRTWKYHVFTKLAHVACADISFAFAPAGTDHKRIVYATSIGYGAPGGIGDGDGVSNYTPAAGLVGQIYLFKSEDGGLTWAAPIVVYDSQDVRNPAAFDRPWVEVDRSNSITRGRIYVSAMTVFVQQALPRIYLKYSDDGGRTFSPPIEVDRTDGDAGRSTAFATLDVGPDGRVMMVYRSWPFGVADDQPDFEGNLADLLHEMGVPEHPNGLNRAAERSGEGFCTSCFSAASIQFTEASLNPDPDANFALLAEDQRPYTITRSGLPFVNRSGEARNSEEGAPYATVAADPTTPGRFAAVFCEPRYSREAQEADFNHVPPNHTAASAPAIDTDISFTWTDDWGAHWSRPVRVNDDLIGNEVIQDRAWLKFDPVTGLPVVVWRDRRHSLAAQGAGTGVMSDLYLAQLESFGRRDWGDAPQTISEPASVNQRRYVDAPSFRANQRLSAPITDKHGGGFTPASSLSDSFFSIAVAPNGVPGPVAVTGTIWAVWAPIVISQGNNTVPDDVVDLESGLRQIVLRIIEPGQPVDLTPFNPLD